jgi:hypothetical protein
MGTNVHVCACVVSTGVCEMIVCVLRVWVCCVCACELATELHTNVFRCVPQPGGINYGSGGAGGGTDKHVVALVVLDAVASTVDGCLCMYVVTGSALTG